ncbi:MAG: hypothetical protein HYR85_17625 [Planctomycetes bacterium]|nr:hypothetical protein [Planctomycetota bacterium]MBI3845275.1 hypothetical protein [Planctomycetota bacterium]
MLLIESDACSEQFFTYEFTEPGIVGSHFASQLPFEEGPKSLQDIAQLFLDPCNQGLTATFRMLFAFVVLSHDWINEIEICGAAAR